MKNNIFFLFLFLFSTLLAQEKELKRIKEKTSPTEVIIYVDSLLFYNSSFSAKQKLNLKYRQALAYQEDNKHIKALKLFQDVASSLDKDSIKYIKVLLFQSNSNVFLKKYTKATEQAIEALNIAKKHNHFNQITASYNALSYIYYATNDFDRALEYLSYSESLQKEQNDSIRLSAIYNNMAIIMKNMGDFEAAIANNKKSLQISLAINDPVGVGKSYSNIGRVYELIGETNKALRYYKLAVGNNKKHSLSNSIPYRNIGDVSMTNKQYKIAEENYTKALKIESENNNQAIIHSIYENLLKTAVHQKDFDKVLFYTKKTDSLQKITTRLENEERVSMIENQQKLFRNQQELQQLKQINTKNRIIFITLLVIALLFLLFLLQRNKNIKLNSQKERLRLEQRVLRSQMNPHFIFNALSAIQNTLLDNDPIKSATYLSRFAKLIRQNFDFINEKSILLKDEIDALRNYMDTQKLRFQDKFDYEINIFSNVNIDSENIPPLLLQPFIENAIEHGFKNKKEEGKITINISKNKDLICYEIIDNGKGFKNKSKDEKEHAIDIFEKRLKLRAKKEEQFFSTQSTDKGTIIKFCLKDD